MFVNNFASVVVEYNKLNTWLDHQLGIIAFMVVVGLMLGALLVFFIAELFVALIAGLIAWAIGGKIWGVRTFCVVGYLAIRSFFEVFNVIDRYIQWRKGQRGLLYESKLKKLLKEYGLA